MAAIQIHMFILCNLRTVFLSNINGCLVAASLREQKNVFKKHFVARVFVSHEFLILHFSNREADDVRMEWKGT